MFLILMALVCAASGCESAFDRHRVSLIRAHDRGDYAAAARELDHANEEMLYGSKNEVLWLLERGAAAAATGDSDLAVSALNRAEAQTELFYSQSATDIAGQWLIGERATRYITRAYENQYINVIKMLAHFQAGTIDNGPTVEARRMASKADQMRDKFADVLDEVRSRGVDDAYTLGNPGAFIESPLGVYLSAIAFRENGESNMASTALKRLRSAAAAQAGLGISGDTSYVDELEGRGASEQDALFVAVGGVGPRLARQSVGPIFIYMTPIYFELPQIVPGGSRASRAIVEIEDPDGSTRTVELSLIEDLSAVAEANFQQELPVVHARTYVRALTKSGLFTAGGIAIRNSDDSPEAQAAGLLVSLIGGLVYLSATEKADVRCWSMLPGVAWAGVLDLPEGKHKARLVFLSPGGQRLHVGEWAPVRGGAHGLDSVIEYWPG